MTVASEALKRAAVAALAHGAVVAAAADAGDAAPARPVLHLLADSGAVMVVRMTGRTEGRLEDAYFPQAASRPTAAHPALANSAAHHADSSYPLSAIDANPHQAAVFRQFIARHTSIDANPHAAALPALLDTPPADPFAQPDAPAPRAPFAAGDSLASLGRGWVRGRPSDGFGPEAATARAAVAVFPATHADPLDCRGQLADAAGRTKVSPAHAPDRRAAFDLAVALGKCRVFGVRPGADVVLSPQAAAQAAVELRDRLERHAEDARALPEILDGAGAWEEEDICLHLVEARTDAWAAMQALDDVYASASGDEGAGLGDVIDGVLDASEAFDDALRDNPEPLAVAAGTRLLDNWKRLLSPEFQDVPPWWLRV